MQPQGLRTGAQFGPYTIVTRLGRGAMAAVYLAKEPAGRKVALKILHGRGAAGESTVERFEREARTVGRMAHANIVEVYDVGHFHGVPFIAMEYVEGTTLREVLSDGPLTLEDGIAIVSQLADGVASAHDAGVVHRDLKPENVMLTPDGTVKILDFGLSKPIAEATSSDTSETVEELTLPGTILGTVQYMSPEQASGYRADFAADQFALGVIFYEILTGVAAFRRDTLARTLAAVIEGRPNPSERYEALPEAVRAVIERALEKAPEDRFRSMRDLAGAIGAIHESLSHPKARSRWAALGAILTTAIIAAAFI